MTAGVMNRIENDRDFYKFCMNSFSRYTGCDWGDLDPEDKQLNDEAVKEGGRILASYKYSKDGTKIWIITEWDRSVTTFLFPDEY